MRIAGLPVFFLLCLSLASCSAVTGSSKQALPAPDTTGSVAAVGTTMPVPAAQPLPDDTMPQTVAFETASAAVPPARPAAIDGATTRGGGALLRDRIYGRRFRDAKPINFGRASPRVFAVHGVDVSRWQREVDWQTLRLQGANFAFIKATDGGDHLDPMFEYNWRQAGDAGLKRGAYHFFYWCRSAADQARWFIRNVPRTKNALPPVLDVEWNAGSDCKKIPSPAEVREKMGVFLRMVEQHYGRRPIIYTAPGFYQDNLEGAFLDYPFWLRSVAMHPSKVFDDRKWVFWQYSGSGLSQGVDGRIDLNVFNGSADAWYRWVDGNAG